MKLNDQQIKELNSLLKRSKLFLPFNKKEVARHNNVYEWLQKNIEEKNKDKITPKLAELLDIQITKK